MCTHQGTESSVKAWFKIKKGTPRYRVSTKQMDEGLYHVEYKAKERCKE